MSFKNPSQKDGSFSFLPMDLTGKLMIKARLGDDVRRVPIHNEDITYDELLLMLQRVFRGKLSNTDDVTVKYADEEGDLVTITDSSDLNLAKQLNRMLKLTIHIHGKEPLPTLDASEVQEVRKELVAIRNKVNVLLDAIDGHPKQASSDMVSQEGRKVTNAISNSTSSQDTVVKSDTSGKKVAPPPATTVTGSITMFDPLKKSGHSQVSTSSFASGNIQPASSNASSTTHLFASTEGSGNDFLSSTSSLQQQQQQQQQQQSGYSSSSRSYQPQSSGSSTNVYSSSPSPSAPQVAPSPHQQQQQPPPQQSQQHDTSQYYQQQQQGQGQYNRSGGYPSQQQQPPPPQQSQPYLNGVPGNFNQTSMTPPQQPPTAGGAYQPPSAGGSYTSNYQMPTLGFQKQGTNYPPYNY